MAQPRPNSWKWWTAVSAGVLVVVAGVWAIVLRTGGAGDGAGLPAELQLASLQNKNPDELGRLVRDALRRDDLTEEQRRELFEQMRQLREQEMDKRIDEYFAAAPTDRDAILDRHLDQMQEEMKEREARRREWEKERGARGGGEGGPPRPPAGSGPGGGDAKPDGAKGDNPPAAGPGQLGERTAGNRGPGGRRGPGQAPSREERKARSESRDPDAAARRMAYMKAMGQRAGERGIKLPFGGGGGPGGPGAGGPGGPGGGRMP